MGFKISIELPDYALDIENVKEIIDEAGKAIRDDVKKNIRAGKDKDGKALHRPKDGGKPMNDTGQLIDSITWKLGKKGDRGNVRPMKGRKKTNKKKGAARPPNNFGLAMILHAKDKRPNSTRPPMRVMDITDEKADKIFKKADDKIKADLKSKRIKVIK